MAEIKFVKTRHVYDSYVDMRTLVSLAGFETIYVDEVDTSQDGVFIFITMNGEVEPHINNQFSKPRNAHLILWNIERPSGSAGSVGQYARRQRDLIYNRIFDEVWVSDRRMADETQLRFVILGSHPELGQPSDDKKFAFCHMSYEVPRRTNIYKYFTPESIGPNCWPPERDEILRQSKFALNIHQDIHPFQEPLRLSLFAAYGLPIISETILDMYPWSDETMITARYDDLVGRLRTGLTEDYEPYREMGLRARQRMTEEFEFSKMVKEAVSQSLDKWR